MIWTTQPRSEGPGDLTFYREGAGPPVVLIHGVGLQAEAWAGVMPSLAQRYTVYAIDMPGHGQAPLHGTLTLDDFVARIGTFVRSLKDPVALAGHSMGAIITLMLADRYPEAITAVAPLNAVFQRTEVATSAVQARADSLLLDGSTDQSPTLARWFGTAPTGNVALARDACADWLKTVDPKGYKAAYTAFAHQDGPSEALLCALTIPALFMTGEGDGNSTPLMSQAMAGHCPDGVARIVKGAAHMMPMTHPDTVARALTDTFEKASDV